MTNLISGKEALIALANGEEVEFKDGADKWENIKYHMNLDLSMFLTSPEWMHFRLKPKPIILNGIEVPKPFEPKYGESAWVVDSATPLGYRKIFHHGEGGRFMCWRTEDEIKQVIAALRTIFKTD